MEPTMNAVVFQGPYDVQVLQRPRPHIVDPTDAILKVEAAGICGSELHPYRGAQKTTTGHILGHEFVGIIEEVGDDVKSFKPGQRVICIFSSVCGTCWFCERGFTNRCEKALALGTQQIDGGQAQYARVPLADGTLVLAPAGIPAELLILMSDILPTGYYAASRALDLFQITNNKGPDLSISPQMQFRAQLVSEAVFVCIGCGPVGLCAILTAVAKGVGTVLAVDSVDDRLQEAKKMGAVPLKLGVDDIQARISELTGGRGADAVIEAVGNTTALQAAFDYLRPCGSLSSIGFHHASIPFTANQAYQKNICMSFGRAPVRAVFQDAFSLLNSRKEKLADFVTHVLPLSDAAHGYKIFDKQEARKVMLKP